MNSIDTLNKYLDETAIKTVHAGLFDQDGVFREKRLPVALFKDLLEQGWTFIDALPWWGPNDVVRDDRAWKSEACEFDLQSFRTYPFEENTALIVADYHGEHRSLSARAVLQDQIQRAAALGLTAIGACEYEFIVLEQSANELRQTKYQSLQEMAGENRCWSGAVPAAAAEFFQAYETLCDKGEIPLHHLCSELGPGCFEVALPKRQLLRAADDAALLKLYTKAFFSQQDKTASFMAQLSEAHPGLGGHPIISLLDSKTEAPILTDHERENGLSIKGEHFLAGILHYTPELTALFAPNVNSYRRYSPKNWAPRTATWGKGNYTCGVRMITDPSSAARIEFRLPGADMNPFMAFAMLLGAGLSGMEAKLTLPDETTSIGRSQDHADIGRLPRNLHEAAERLKESKLARGIFGDAFVDHHVNCCIDEADTLSQFVSAQERERYLFHV